MSGPVSAEYMRQWRKTEAGKKSVMAERARARARGRAIKRLIEMHEREWKRLYWEEVGKCGIDAEAIRPEDGQHEPIQ